MRMRVHRSETDLGHAVAARFTYRPYDPYAIEAVFHPGDPSEKVWHFARDLLVDGLEGSAGEGDVMVWHDRRPSCETRESSIFIRLVSDEGTALLSAPRAHLQEYVVVTLRAVATGTEHEFLDGELNDLDGELVQLTCGGLGD
ncbi:SsgA family sporulation/cell division regulator [Streptomyces sp. AcH 505]|uniref:SsgA family sporulation/cell division regulator n=1 Tax=Streptomyces sp. AcH 505 TaxID=352211 RepID=UPI0012FF57A1